MPNYTHLTIKATGPISEYEAFYLEEEDNPKKIVIDIKNAIFEIEGFPKNILTLNMGSVRRVRFGQFESEPIQITRVVIDLYQETNYEVKLSSDKRLLLYIDVYDYTEFKKPEEQIFTVTPVKSEAVKIEKKEEPIISILDVYKEPINLKFYDEDVVNVIRGLSELTGIDIMIDDSVTGNVTLNLKNKTFRETIELIMMNKGLSYTERSNTLIIAAKDVIEGYKDPITRVYELKNATAEEAKIILDGYVNEELPVNIVADARMNTLIVSGTNGELKKIEEIIGTIDEELLTRTFRIDNAIDEEDIEAIKNMLSIIISDTENRVIIDNRQNEIIVKGTREELNKVAELIPKLDKRAIQMRIEVKFIEVSLNKEKDLGIKWTAGVEDEEGNLLEGQINIGVLSNPIIYTLNGKKAFLLSGTRVPYEEQPPGGGKMITWENVGVNMTLTPWISSDGLVTMLLRAEKSYLGAVEIKDLRTIETQQIGYKEGDGPALLLRTPPDKIAVVGGLIKTTDREDIVKIPLLGDIPIIGELFRRTNTIHDKTEIIILITVHILDY